MVPNWNYGYEDRTMKFRLLSAHYLPGDLYAYGDKEAEAEKGQQGGSIIDNGSVITHDGKRFPLDMKEFKPTLEMVALDVEAEEALAEEYDRLQRNQNVESGVAIVPIDQLPRFVENYEARYTPGGFTKRKAAIAFAAMLAASAANAQTFPMGLDAFALDNQQSGEGVSSFAFSSPKKTMRSLTARATAAGFIYLFDAASLPSNGAVAACTSAATARPCYVWCYPLAANGVVFMQWDSPIQFTTNVLAAYGSTGCASFTASATAQFSGQAP